MSKGMKTVLAIGAAVAIPWAAPKIFAALATSFGAGALGTFGSIAGSAITGAALGAASNRVLGMSGRQGALTGALGGALGGYLQAGQAAGTGAQAAQTAGAVPTQGGVTAGLPAATPVTAPAGGATLPQGGMFGGELAAKGQSFVAPPPMTTAPTVITQRGLSSALPPNMTFGGAGATGLQGQVTQAGLAPPGASPVGFGGIGNTPGITPAPTMATTGGSTIGTGFSGSVQAGGGAPAAGLSPAGPATRSMDVAGLFSSGGAPAAGTGGPAPTFWEAAKSVPGEIAAKFKDPKMLADLTLRAGAQLAGSALAGDGLSDEEKQLLEARTREMQQLQQQNAAVFAQRMNEARMLADESRYYDPSYFGRQRATQAQIAGGRAAQAGTRGLTGGARSTAQRRYELETARNVGSAYDVGYGAGVQGRLATRQAGLNALPSPVIYESPGTDVGLEAAALARRRRGEDAKRIGDIFGPITA